MAEILQGTSSTSQSPLPSHWSPSLESQASLSEPATPFTSESEFSDAASIGSVKLAALVQQRIGGVVETSTLVSPDPFRGTAPQGDSQKVRSSSSSGTDSMTRQPSSADDTASLTQPQGASIISDGAQKRLDTSTHPTLPKRNTNPRNLVIDTETAQNACASPSLASSPAFVSTAGLRITKTPSTAQPDKRRVSVASVHSYDEEDARLLAQPSSERMQGLLGAKMKHISPAPWRLSEARSEISDAGSSTALSVSTSSNTVDEDPEIGSVQTATKSPRTGQGFRSVFGAASTTWSTSTSTDPPTATARAETATLKGLGLALTLPKRSNTAKLVPVPTAQQRQRSGTAPATLVAPLEVHSAPSDQPVQAASPNKSIVSGDDKLPFPSSAPSTQIFFDPSTHPTSIPPSSSDHAKSDETHGPPTPAKHERRRSLSGSTDAPHRRTKNQTPDSHGRSAASTPNTRPPTPPQQTTASVRSLQSGQRKRPPIYHQDTDTSILSAATVSPASKTSTGGRSMPSSVSLTSLPSPLLSNSLDLPPKHIGATGNGIKLISLDAAREREKNKSSLPRLPKAEPLTGTASSAARSANPSDVPLQSTNAPPNGVKVDSAAAGANPKPKVKKSGFLKLFKSKEGTFSGTSPQLRSISRSISKDDIALVSNAATPTDARPPRPRQNSAPDTSRRKATVLAPGSESALESVLSTQEARHANAPGPPTVSLQAPSPDPNEESAKTDDGKQSRVFARNQAGPGNLAPSLSLRPVSMMFASMPQAFLADSSSVPLPVTGSEGQRANSSRREYSSSSASSRSNSNDTLSLARSPDAPSFTFSDSEGILTPPSAYTPIHHLHGTPSPTSATFDARKAASPAPSGLPTPPHSASSTRSNHFDSVVPANGNDAVISAAAHRALILDLESQIASLKAQVARLSATEAKGQGSTPTEASFPDSALPSQPCQACGCSCSSSKASHSDVVSEGEGLGTPVMPSVLERERPRVSGHGKLFSSNRDRDELGRLNI